MIVTMEPVLSEKMTTEKKMGWVKAALVCWLKSALFAVGGCGLVWVVCYGFAGLLSSQILECLAWGGIFALYSMVVHLVAYTVTGIPLLLWIYAKQWTFVNRLPNALLLGGGLGALVGILILFVQGNFGGMNVWLTHIVILLMLTGYGLVTGYAAWRFRLR